MKSFELASTTPISLDDLRAAAGRLDGASLCTAYAAADPAFEAESVIARLSADDSELEEHVRSLDSRESVFALAAVFAEHLAGDMETTDVPGHGTVTDVGVADGTLSVHENLVVEGTLVVAGDLIVGGQLVVGDDGVVAVAGNAQLAAMISQGDVSVGGDLHSMFIDLVGEGRTLDVGGELDSFLLVQDGQVVRLSSISVGLHAVIGERGPRGVFQPSVLRNGKPDWMAIARAARAGDDVFVEGYRPPTAGEHDALVIL